MIRPFLSSDIVWIKPIAMKYGEWEAIRDGLMGRDNYIVLCTWVIEGKALVALFEDIDDHEKTIVCGLCDSNGIKELFELGHFIVKLARGFSHVLYSPKLDAGSWQEKFFKKMGFVESGPGHFILPLEESCAVAKRLQKVL